MSLTFCVLASGSKGNATYVGNDKAAVLVDCGLSARELMRRLGEMGLEAGRLRAIIVTHEHRDHLAGARVLAKQLGLPVLGTRGTLSKAGELPGVKRQPFAAGEEFSLAGFTFHPFAIPHDAADPVGLVVKMGATRLGVCTDLGQALKLVRERLMGCQALVMETNHDPAMLAEGDYPPWLKQRVRSRTGHLSNQQGAELLGQLHHAELRQVVLAHLSEKNNQPRLAEEAVRAVLEPMGCRTRVALASQQRPTAVFEL